MQLSTKDATDQAPGTLQSVVTRSSALKPIAISSCAGLKEILSTTTFVVAPS
jgi:hypothetical protein